MNTHALLRFLHITSFAAWFGTVLASLFLLKALETKLTGEEEGDTAGYAGLLQKYIRLETKVADIAFTGTIFSGIVLAGLYHGWTVWVLVKSGLIVLQVALTMGYIVKSLRPITYPCSPSEYRNWYRLFGISLSMFAFVLLVSFFLL